MEVKILHQVIFQSIFIATNACKFFYMSYTMAPDPYNGSANRLAKPSRAGPLKSKSLQRCVCLAHIMIYHQPGNHVSSQKVFPGYKDALYPLQKNAVRLLQMHSIWLTTGFSFAIAYRHLSTVLKLPWHHISGRIIFYMHYITATFQQ